MGGVRVRVALDSGLLATEVQDSKLSLRSRTTSSSTRRASAMKHAHQRQGQGRPQEWNQDQGSITLSAGCAEDIAEWTTGPNSSITQAKGQPSSEYGMSRKPLHLSYDERPLRKGMRPNGPKSAKSTVGGERQPLKGRGEAREKDTNQQLHWLRTPAQLPAS